MRLVALTAYPPPRVGGPSMPCVLHSPACFPLAHNHKEEYSARLLSPYSSTAQKCNAIHCVFLPNMQINICRLCHFGELIPPLEVIATEIDSFFPQIIVTALAIISIQEVHFLHDGHYNNFHDTDEKILNTLRTSRMCVDCVRIHHPSVIHNRNINIDFLILYTFEASVNPR